MIRDVFHPNVSLAWKCPLRMYTQACTGNGRQQAVLVVSDYMGFGSRAGLSSGDQDFLDSHDLPS